MEELKQAILEKYEELNIEQIDESASTWLAKLHTTFNEDTFERNILAPVLSAVKGIDGQVPDEKMVRGAILDAVNASVDKLIKDWDKKYVDKK